MTLYERFEKLSDGPTSTSTRRRLLARAGKASLGFAFVLAGLGRADKASATSPYPAVGCCSLAYNAECPNCTGAGYDCPSGCTRWAWYCVDSTGRVWLCGECYTGGSCTGCSCGRYTGLSRNSRGVPRPGGGPGGGPQP